MSSGVIQIRVKELGIKKVLNNYPPRIVTSKYGVIRVNTNAYKQLKRWLGGNIVANAPNARDDLFGWLRTWNGELWLFRVATDAYVDFDPAHVLEYVRSLIPEWDEIRAGSLYGKGVYMLEGARYAEGVWGVRGNGVVKGIWLRTGDDGYTAIRIRPFYLFPKEISAIILPNSVSRRLHVSSRTILERVRQDVDASLATLKTFDIEPLKDLPVPFTVINNLARKVRGFANYWRQFSQVYGSNAYALAITLGRVLTTTSGETRERVANLLVELTAYPRDFIEVYSQVEKTVPRELVVEGGEE